MSEQEHMITCPQCGGTGLVPDRPLRAQFPFREHEEDVLRLLFGDYPVRDNQLRTLKEVGSILGIDAPRVGRIRSSVLRRILYVDLTRFTPEIRVKLEPLQASMRNE